MKKRQGNKGQPRQRPVRARSPGFSAQAAFTVMACAVIAAAGFYLFLGQPTAAQGPTTPESASVPEATPGFDRLIGRWRRPDGGYVIEISDIDSGGKMTAAYFNPRPINVSRAEAALDGTTLRVFVELRDVNYPGATYRLTYDPGSDQLRGIYHQPALQQSFEVFFVRMK